MVYSTYLTGSGGNWNGLRSDTAVAVAVDAAGDAYVVGTVFSLDFPFTMSAFRVSCTESLADSCGSPGVYVLKVAPDGQSLGYSTYVGEGTAAGIGLDSTGAAWVVGNAGSYHYPFLHAIQSTLPQVVPVLAAGAVVTRLDVTGMPTFSSYFGSSFSASGAAGVAIDSTGNAYITGDAPYTMSVTPSVANDLPFVNPLTPFLPSSTYSAYVAKITPASGGPVLSLSPPVAPLVTLRNVGDQTLTLTNITPVSPLALVGSTCGSSLAAGTSCELVLDYQGTPAGVSTLTITSNSPASPQSFNIMAPPPSYFPWPLFTIPGALDFPAQLVGTSAAEPIVITNLGYNLTPTDISITSLGVLPANPAEGISGDFSETNNCPTALAPGASCTVNVQYQPTAGADGIEFNQLALEDSYGQTGTAFPDLRAMRSSSALVASGGSNQLGRNNAPLQFGAQNEGATPLPRVVSLTNISSQQVTLSGFEVSGPFSQTNNCSGALAPKTSCRVSISFVPTGNGNFTGTVTVGNSGQGGATVINMTGTGLIPSALSVDPLTLQFGSVLAGTTSTLPLTLTNVTSATVSILSYALSTNFSQTNNCGGSLAAGGTCTVSVSFTPTALGPITGTITIQPSGAGPAQVVSLSGTGATALEFSAQSLTFGDQNDGTTSPPQTVEIGNSGAAPVTISSVSVSAPFLLVSNSCVTTLATYADCTVQVAFSPASGVGVSDGELTVVANDFEGTHVIPLSGTATSLPIVNLSPASLNFGSQAMSSTSAAQTVTVSNTGTLSLAFSSIIASGPFVESNTCGAAVPVNGSCSISVTYTPTAAGPQSGMLTLSDNAADSPQSVPLSGTGADFSLSMASGSSTSATISPGGKATYNLSVAPMSGLTGSVSFACTGAPSEATCTVNPSTATLNASSATPISVTVTTTAASGAPVRQHPPGIPPVWLWMLALLGMLATELIAVRQPASRRAWIPLVAVLLGLVLLPACGGGGGGGGGGGTSPTNPGTPAGTYTLTVAGTYTSGGAADKHTLTLSLTLN